MSVINNSSAAAFIDALTSTYVAILGNASFGLGNQGQGNGAAPISLTVPAAVIAADDIDPIVALGAAAQDFAARVNIEHMASTLFAGSIVALASHLNAFGTNVRQLDDYLTQQNLQQGTKWLLMVSAPYAAIHKLAVSQTLSRCNVWFEVIQGSTYTNALYSFVVGGAATVGVQIGSAYAGGFPFIKGVGIVGGGVVTVTGSAYNPATQAVETGKTWVATLAAGDSTVALAPGGSTPAAANSLILAVSATAVDNAITAGEVYAEAHRPSGRPQF